MICMLLTYSLPVFAESNLVITTSYTTEGIFYDAIALENERYMPLSDTDTITLTQEITYSGIISPSAFIPWTEIVDGTTYSGTLYLQSFSYTSNKTSAIYKGILTAQ